MLFTQIDFNMNNSKIKIVLKIVIYISFALYGLFLLLQFQDLCADGFNEYKDTKLRNIFPIIGGVAYALYMGMCIILGFETGVQLHKLSNKD